MMSTAATSISTAARTPTTASSTGAGPATPPTPEEHHECFFEPSLFLNEDYTPHTVAVTPRVSLTLLASSAASTDVDLTGQVIWPASVLLGRWLLLHAAGGGGGGGGGGTADDRGSVGRLPAAPRFLELGAGVGVAGLTAAAAFPAASVVLTDGSAVVLRVLDANAAAASAAAAASRGHQHPPRRPASAAEACCRCLCHGRH